MGHLDMIILIFMEECKTTKHNATEEKTPSTPVDMQHQEPQQIAPAAKLSDLWLHAPCKPQLSTLQGHAGGPGQELLGEHLVAHGQPQAPAVPLN